MRRIVVSILLLLYTGLFAIGLPLNLHYCGGSFSGIVLADENGNCCDLPVTDDCCETKHAYIKAENNHQTAAQVTTPAAQLLWINNSFFISSTNVSNISRQVAANNHCIKESPPPAEAFILLRNLRI